MSAVEANVQSAQYVDFWNEILVPKFIKYKHILVDGLTHHSEAIFPSLPVKEGDRVLDIGCGFGDTAIKLAHARVGLSGKVVGLDCCEAFLDYGRKDAAKLGVQNVSFVYGDALLDHFKPEYDFVFSRFGTMFFANPVAGLRNVAEREAGWHHDAYCMAHPQRQSVAQHGQGRCFEVLAATRRRCAHLWARAIFDGGPGNGHQDDGDRRLP